MSFKVCDWQPQHVYLNYFLGLTSGITEIPTDFHAGWYQETKGGPDSLQTPWIGTLYCFGVTLRGVLTFLWPTSAQCCGFVEHVPSKTGPTFLLPLLCVTGYTEKENQILAKIKTFSKSVSSN